MAEKPNDKKPLWSEAITTFAKVLMVIGYAWLIGFFFALAVQKAGGFGDIKIHIQLQMPASNPAPLFKKENEKVYT